MSVWIQSCHHDASTVVLLSSFPPQMTCERGIMMHRQTLLTQIIDIRHHNLTASAPDTITESQCSSIFLISKPLIDSIPVCRSRPPGTLSSPAGAHSASMLIKVHINVEQRLMGSVTLAEPLRYSYLKSKRDRNCCHRTCLLLSCTEGLLSR